MIVIFPNNEKKWRAEILAAQEAGFQTHFFGWHDLHMWKMSDCLNKVPAQNKETPALLRCSVLNLSDYFRLNSSLLEEKNIRLVNGRKGYPGGLLPYTMRSISTLLPDTLFVPAERIGTAAQEIFRHFGEGKLMLKAMWGSAKYLRKEPWDISNAGDQAETAKAIEQLSVNFGHITGGLMVSRFEELRKVSPYKLPFTGQSMYEEYRLFFFRGQLAALGNYFEELPDHNDLLDQEEIRQVCQVAANITSSNFFVLDIARKTNGKLIAIETNPGEVSGFAIRYASKLYQGIKQILEK